MNKSSNYLNLFDFKCLLPHPELYTLEMILIKNRNRCLLLDYSIYNLFPRNGTLETKHTKKKIEANETRTTNIQPINPRQSSTNFSQCNRPTRKESRNDRELYISIYILYPNRRYIGVYVRVAGTGQTWTRTRTRVAQQSHKKYAIRYPKRRANERRSLGFTLNYLQLVLGGAQADDGPMDRWSDGPMDKWTGGWKKTV